MAHDKSGDIVGLGQLHKLMGDFANLTDRALHTGNIRAHDGLDGVDNQEIWFNLLNLGSNGLHIGLGIEIKLTVDVAQALGPQLNLLGRLFS